MLEFKEPEPEKYDKKGLRLGMKIKTSAYISWEIRKAHYDNFNSVSKEKRQEFLNLWRKGGISIKEASEKCGLDSNVGADIIYLNIQKNTYHYLRDESL